MGAGEPTASQPPAWPSAYLSVSSWQAESTRPWHSARAPALPTSLLLTTSSLKSRLALSTEARGSQLAAVRLQYSSLGAGRGPAEGACIGAPSRPRQRGLQRWGPLHSEHQEADFLDSTQSLLGTAQLGPGGRHQPKSLSVGIQASCQRATAPTSRGSLRSPRNAPSRVPTADRQVLTETLAARGCRAETDQVAGHTHCSFSRWHWGSRSPSQSSLRPASPSGLSLR